MEQEGVEALIEHNQRIAQATTNSEAELSKAQSTHSDILSSISKSRASKSKLIEDSYQLRIQLVEVKNEIQHHEDIIQQLDRMINSLQEQAARHMKLVNYEDYVQALCENYDVAINSHQEDNLNQELMITRNSYRQKRVELTRIDQEIQSMKEHMEAKQCTERPPLQTIVEPEQTNVPDKMCAFSQVLKW